MSPRPDQVPSGEHARAADLAALRLDEPLMARETEWLDRHLAGCQDCRSVAAEYDEDRALLRGLRDVTPVPPRDLWARTAAAIEVEHGARRPSRGFWRLGRLPLAPVAAFLVAAIAFGAGFLNGAFPFGPGHGSPFPTPIQVGSGEVRVLTLAADGSLSVSSKRYDQVCPIGTSVCNGSTATDGSTRTIPLADLGLVDAYLSPLQDHIVVLQKGSDPSGVFVVPVNPFPNGSPSANPTPPPGSPSASETPSTGPVSPTPSATSSEQPSASPTATPEPSGSANAPDNPVPSASVSVTPQPDGTIQIAHDVIVVGSISAYSSDGTRFAFTARPADGSTGPDIYVWNTAESQARPVTSDHASLFAAWVHNSLLVSRVVNGTATTTLLDPTTGVAEPIAAGTAWRPAPGPGDSTAVWWDGTITRSEDGFGWVPGSGRLVLGSWPSGAAALQPATASPADTPTPDPAASPAETPTPSPAARAFELQTLAQGPLREWQVRWDPSGATMAVWVATGAAGAPGLLSLYAIDPATGAANLATPLLSNAPAYGGFSLLAGRLTWSVPTTTGASVLDVLAWSGTSIGQIELTVGQGTTLIR